MGLLEAGISGGLNVIGNLAGSYLTGRSNDRATEANAAIQRELAQNGISWRVADAKKAGINPLAALGASIPSGSPVAVGQDFGDLGLGNLGQDISRAMTAKMTPEQREIHELNKQMLQAQIEGQRLDNASKATTPPPLPSADFTNPSGKIDPTVEVIPTQVNASRQPGVESGIKPMYQYVIDDENVLRTMPTSSLSDVMESHTPSYIYEMQKNLRMLFNSYNAAIGSPERQEKIKRKYATYLSGIRPKHDNWPKYEYRYDIRKQGWIPSRVINGNHQLYTTPMKDQSGVKFKIRRWEK